MKSKNIIGSIIIILILITGCSTEKGISIVTINLGLGNQSNASLLDKILHFLQTPVYAAPPSNIVKITVNVTASDISTISKEFMPPFGTITIEVSSGIQRTIEVLADTPSATIRGVAIVDLEPGENTVNISMHLNRTKIIVPDYYNYRLVQMDDMSGTGFTAINASSIGFMGTLYPYDVDFDDIGRIYIANCYNNNDYHYYIIRVNDFISPSITPIASSGSEITCITVDRKRNYIYFADWEKIYRCNLDGTNLYSDFNFNQDNQLYYFRSIAVDNDGFLFTACTVDSTGDYRIVKLDPNSGNGQIIKISEISNDDEWLDVIIKNGQCIVAYHDGYSNNDAIILLNPYTLSEIARYGTGTTNANPGPGLFWGPRRFVAILNDKFYLIDEGVGDNLVSFSDFNFNDWQRYANGFAFFSVC